MASPLLRLTSLADVENFFRFTASRSLAHIRSIELTLNANNFCDYRDDLLATAFRRFHPLDEENPHNIDKLIVNVEGMVLFTRQTYTVISPAGSWDVDKELEGLLSGRTTVKEKEELAFGVRSQEKAFVAALLGIRGVRQVEVTGNMESGLTEEILENLTMRVGAPVPTPPPRGPLGVNGIFWSSAYEGKRAHDNTYTPYTKKAPFSSNEDPPAPTTRLRRRVSVKDAANPYRIETLKRVAAKPQDGDDYGPGRHGVTKRHYEYMDQHNDPEGRLGKDWIIPSGKGARCTMGWNAVEDGD